MDDIQLSSDKTEAVVVGTKPKRPLLLPNTSRLSYKLIGVTLDNATKHLSRRISYILKYSTADASAKLVTSSIFSRLGYCKSLFLGLPSTYVACTDPEQCSLTQKKESRQCHSSPPSSLLVTCFCLNPKQNRHPILQGS